MRDERLEFQVAGERIALELGNARARRWAQAIYTQFPDAQGLREAWTAQRNGDPGLGRSRIAKSNVFTAARKVDYCAGPS